MGGYVMDKNRFPSSRKTVNMEAEFYPNDIRMKTSEKAKAVGLKNLAELSEITGQSTQTLRNWDENKPELFAVVLEGAASKKIAGKA